MLRLAMILYSLIGTTLAGSAVIAALTMGYDTLQPILIAAELAAVLAVLAMLVVARKLVAE